MELSNRVTSIDGLRGLAALGVAWFHLYTQIGLPHAPDEVPHLLNLLSVWGRWGVQLFFVISGFVVSFTMFERDNLTKPSSILLYFVRRSVRLDPTYWVCLFLTVLIVPAIAGISHDNLENIYPKQTGDIQQNIKNVLYFLPVAGSLYLPVTWTLAIEVHFYVMFMICLVVTNLLGVWGQRDIFANGILLALLGAWVFARGEGLAAEDGLLFNLHCFLLGILISNVYKALKFARVSLAITAVVILGLFLWLRQNDLLAGIVASSIVCAVVFVMPGRRFIEFAFFSFLGSLSYGIYLVHDLVGALAIRFMQVIFGQPKGLYNLAFLIIGVCVTVLCAWLIRIAIEVPSIAASKMVPIDVMK